MSQEAEALRRAIGAVNEARRLVSDLQQFDIRDSTDDEIEIDRLVDGLDEIHSELDDAIYALENAEDEADEWEEDEEPWNDDE